MGVKISDDVEDMLRVEVQGRKGLGDIHSKSILLPVATLDKLLQEIDYWRKEANREWKRE